MANPREWIQGIIRQQADLPPAVTQMLQELAKSNGLGVSPKELGRAESLAKTKEFRLLAEVFPEKSRNRELALIGLRLRQDQKNKKVVDDYLRKVRSGYGIAGRHAAQAVQCGGVTRLLKDLRSQGCSTASQVQILNLFMDEIDAHARFVTDLDSAPVVAAQVSVRLSAADGPDFYLVAGSGTAVKVAKEAMKILELQLGARFQVFKEQNDPSSYMALIVRL